MTYQINGRPRLIEYFAVGILTALLLYTPLAQFYAEHHIQAEVFWTYPILLYFWYILLKPARSVIVSESDVVVKTGFGTHRFAVADVLSIRPFMNLSGRNFVLQRRRGYELLFGDPSVVALLARELLERNPKIQTLRIPQDPVSPN